MKVKCERDGTVFKAFPHPGRMSKERAEEDGLAYPVRYINCPTCFRGYYLETDGKWRSDRELTILEE